MPYDVDLADRVQPLLIGRKGVVQKAMFGGLAFLLNGHVCVGIWKDCLIVRLGIGQSEDALRLKGVHPFDITGRAMRGWVMIEKAGLDDHDELAEWVEKGVRIARTLPAK